MAERRKIIDAPMAERQEVPMPAQTAERRAVIDLDMFLAATSPEHPAGQVLRFRNVLYTGPTTRCANCGRDNAAEALECTRCNTPLPTT